MAWAIDAFVMGFAAYGEAMYAGPLHDDPGRWDAEQIRSAPTYFRGVDALKEWHLETRRAVDAHASAQGPLLALIGSSSRQLARPLLS